MGSEKILCVVYIPADNLLCFQHQSALPPLPPPPPQKKKFKVAYNFENKKKKHDVPFYVLKNDTCLQTTIKALSELLHTDTILVYIYTLS